MDQLLKTVRITDNIKVEVYQQGRNRKYVLFHDEYQTRSEKYNISMSDDSSIEESLKIYNSRFGDYTKSYKVIQDPYNEKYLTRTYGNGDKSPYYLNNGCQINILWKGSVPNPDFIPGNNPVDNDSPSNKRFLDNQVITSLSDDAGNKDTLPKSTWTIEMPFEMPSPQVQGQTIMSEPNFKDTSYIWDKIVTVTLPSESTDVDKILVLTTENSGLQYSSKSKGGSSLYSNTMKDYDIISSVINDFSRKASSLHGIDYSGLSLCSPDTGSCSIIEYKSPLEAPTNSSINSNQEPKGATQSPPKIKLVIDGIADKLQVKAKENIPAFTIWTGDIPKTKEIDVFDDSQEIDDEYLESVFAGEEENAPKYISEVSRSADSISDTSSVSEYIPDPNAKPGTIVALPRNYSHTSEQGYNLLNSQWIGDLISSAKSHIGHPTYDIEGTEKGNLGCASAVSMIFYRAFGVHMETGKPVKAKPTDIGSFGTKGTAVAASWFKNMNLYQKIPWKDAQPGDIINTARKEPKAGHIGVVIDVKDKDGSWAIISNSSKGFAGGGGGAVKQNYSIKKWQSVTDRNPEGTFAFRYIGPRLSPGQTA